MYVYIYVCVYIYIYIWLFERNVTRSVMPCDLGLESCENTEIFYIEFLPERYKLTKPVNPTKQQVDI